MCIPFFIKKWKNMPKFKIKGVNLSTFSMQCKWIYSELNKDMV